MQQSFMPVISAFSVAVAFFYGPQVIVSIVGAGDPQAMVASAQPQASPSPKSRKTSSTQEDPQKPQTKVVITHVPARPPSEVFNEDVSNLDAKATAQFLQPLVASGKLPAYEVSYLVAQEQMVSGKISPQFDDLVKSLRAVTGVNPQVAYALDRKARASLSAAAKSYTQQIAQIRAARTARAHAMLEVLLVVMVGAGVAAAGSRKLARRQRYLQGSMGLDGRAAQT